MPSRKLSIWQNFPPKIQTRSSALSKEGKVMYANPASNVILNTWDCEVGDKAPKFWCDLAVKRLRAGKTILLILSIRE